MNTNSFKNWLKLHWKTIMKYTIEAIIIFIVGYYIFHVVIESAAKGAVEGMLSAGGYS